MLCYKKQQVCLEKKKYHGRGKKAGVIWNFIGTPPLVWGNTSTSIGLAKKRWRIRRSAVQQKKVNLQYFYLLQHDIPLKLTNTVNCQNALNLLEWLIQCSKQAAGHVALTKLMQVLFDSNLIDCDPSLDLGDDDVQPTCHEMSPPSIVKRKFFWGKNVLLSKHLQYNCFSQHPTLM